MQFSELCKKEVICTKDCRRLGYVVDLEIEPCKGYIQKIIVKEKQGFCGLFCCGEEFVISFCNVCKIGPDIILVDL